MNTTSTSALRLDLFGLTHPPFPLALRPLFLDDQRQHAHRQLTTFLQRRGFAVLTAPPGTGKTTFITALTESLNPNAHRCFYIPFAHFSEQDMLHALAYQLDLQPAFTKAATIRLLHTTLKNLAPINCLLILDECQKIAHPTLDLIRLLTNCQGESSHFFSVLFLGTPEFLELLRLRINEPVRQRLTLFLRFQPFLREHTQLYLSHHLKSAGAQQELFAPNAVSLIHDLSGGIPRLINTIALAALDAAAAELQPVVHLHHVQRAQDFVLMPLRETTP